MIFCCMAHSKLYISTQDKRHKLELKEVISIIGSNGKPTQRSIFSDMLHSDLAIQIILVLWAEVLRYLPLKLLPPHYNNVDDWNLWYSKHWNFTFYKFKTGIFRNNVLGKSKMFTDKVVPLVRGYFNLFFIVVRSILEIPLTSTVLLLQISQNIRTWDQNYAAAG